mmetsp:Transcript_29962/g.63535  ORF Transcript_29962/g.63535 Transcript_29962/m.63535 type:complete len:249 (-) Transcript_29962:205-951(-)
MGDHSANALLLVGGCFGWVNQKFNLTIRHKAPIFHCSGSKFRNRHHVKFRQRVGNTKEVIIGIQRFRGTIKGKETGLGFARRRVHSHHHSMTGLCLDIVEFTNAKGHEVGGHDGSVQKRQLLLLTPRKSFVGELGHVAECIQVLGNGECDTENCFAGGFVPARKGTPGIQTLKLGTRHNLTLPMNISVAAPVKSSHLIVQKSSVLNGQNQCSIGRKRTPKTKRHRCRFQIDANFLGLVTLAFATLDNV